jgi:hypothetical protein
MLNGDHKVSFAARNSEGESAFEEVIFTKSVNTIEFYRPPNLPLIIRPVSVSFTTNGSFPTGSVLKIEISNNAFDISPTWEDVTSAAKNSQSYTFVNTLKTDDHWGVALKFKLERSAALGDCFIRHMIIRYTT